MRGNIYNVHVPSLLPPMLCIGSTTITTGNKHARRFVNALCLSIRNKILLMIVFSRFNDVELFHSMFGFCCMLKSRPMAAIGQRRPPLLIDIDRACCRNRLLPLFILLFCHNRNHASYPRDVPSWTRQHNNQFGKEAAKPTAPMPEGMLIVTLSGKPWYVTLRIPT